MSKEVGLMFQVIYNDTATQDTDIECIRIAHFYKGRIVRSGTELQGLLESLNSRFPKGRYDLFEFNNRLKLLKAKAIINRKYRGTDLVFVRDEL